MILMDFIRGLFCPKCNNTLYIEQIKTLKATLQQTVPTISLRLCDNIVEPRKLIQNVETADLKYLAYPTDEWVELLDDLNACDQMKYKTRVFDCDDFALVYSASLAVSAYFSGLVLQPAFGIAWSRTHAFNVFIDDGGIVHKYEPQTNKIITNDSPDYDLVKIWFLS